MRRASLRLFTKLAFSAGIVVSAGGFGSGRGGDAPNQHELLEKARAANGDVYATLMSFVCREDISRFRSNLSGDKKRTIDRVTAALSFENGVEHYSDIRQNSHVRPSLSSLTGAWSEGEYGTLLHQTQKQLQTQNVAFVEFSTVGETPAAIYRFAVFRGESPWDLEVDGQHYAIPFQTDVWISVASGEILKISRKSLEIPSDTRISEISWDVTLGAVNLSGKRWLLPSAASYSVSYALSDRREWNEMSFSGYRRYGSESILRFE